MNKKPEVPIEYLVFNPWKYYWSQKGLTEKGILYKKKANQLFILGISLLILSVLYNFKFGIWN